MSKWTAQAISLGVTNSVERKTEVDIKELDIMASSTTTGPTDLKVQRTESTTDEQGGLSRFVGGNRTAQDLWWLREQFDLLTKKLKLYGPHFEDELSTLERALELFGDKEPEKADKDAQRPVEVKKRLMKDYRKSLDEDSDKPDAPKRAIIEAFYTRLGSSQENPTSREPEPGKLQRAGTRTQFEAEKVQRVRLNSDTLSEELQDITGIRLGFTPLFANPFKLFVQYHAEIEERLVDLRQEFTATYGEIPTSSKEDSENEGPTPQSRQGPQASEPPAKSAVQRQRSVPTSTTGSSEVATGNTTPTSDGDIETQRQKDRMLLRLNHLQCLCDFIRTDLSHILSLRQRIADGSIQSVAFEDLWHLFKPGDLVMSTDRGRAQLFSAYHITGGQVRKRKRTRYEVDELENYQYRMESGTRRYYAEDPRDEEDPGDRGDSLEKFMAEQTNYSGSWGPLIVNCYMLVSDGTMIGPQEHYISIDPYSGEKAITELEVFPLRFHPQQDTIIEDMERRGRLFLSSPGHQSYDGLSLVLRRREVREDLHGEVFIDLDSYYANFPTNRPKFATLQKSKADATQNSEVFEDERDPVDLIDSEVDDKRTEDYMSTDLGAFEPVMAKSIPADSNKVKLMPHRVIGYVFRSRRWYALDIELLKSIDKSDTARRTGFQDLVIGDQQRKLLVALVENHEAGQKIVDDDTRKLAYEPPVQIDLVRGKGRGLIILLHGPPGSGKTSTAETIAAYTSRPLYAITCGDIGSTSHEVERNLETHARRAEKWGCVLLLDEADVFLAGRNRYRSAERNALVSIFLRQLEYYSGILFLTTNRVGEIDEAFKSRVHVALRYPKIDLPSTLKIWESTMRRLKRENQHRDIKIEFNESSLLKWATKSFQKLDSHSSGGGESKTWNGRQIRNAFQTAVSLAHYERPEKLLNDFGMTVAQADASTDPMHKRIYLEKELFKQIADIATEFEDYLSTVRGPDQRLAMQSSLRNDSYRAEGAGDGGGQQPRKAYAALAERARKGGSTSGSSKTQQVRAAPAAYVRSEGGSEDESDGSEEDSD